MILALPINIHIDIPPTVGIDINVTDNFFGGKFDRVVGYPFMTTDFLPLVKLNRDDYWQLENFLRTFASKRYDWRTKKYVPCDGMEKDNRQTFTVGGLAFQFYDHALYVGLEAGMKVGNFF